MSEKRTYTQYTDQVKSKFFKLKFEKCLSASTAAKQFGIHVRTGQRWATQYEERSKTIIEKGKKAGRTCILTEEQSKVLRTTIFDKNPSAVVEQATE